MTKSIIRAAFKRLRVGRTGGIALLPKTKQWQGLLLMLFSLGVVSTAQAAIPASERAVLTDLYASTNGAGWINNAGWGGAAGTECTWYGVTCDNTQSNVTSISLDGNKLVGTLPAISGLTALQMEWAGPRRFPGSCFKGSLNIHLVRNVQGNHAECVHLEG